MDDVCTTCGHRSFHGARANGPLTDTRNLIELELTTTTDKQQRVDLLCAMASLKVMAAWNMVDKRDKSAKKVRLRAKKSEAEKVLKRITRKPRPGILPQETVDAIRAKFPDPVKPEETVAATEQESLQTFLSNLKPKEEKPNED